MRKSLVWYEYWRDARGRYRGHYVQLRKGRVIWYSPKNVGYGDPSEVGG